MASKAVQEIKLGFFVAVGFWAFMLVLGVIVALSIGAAGSSS